MSPRKPNPKPPLDRSDSNPAPLPSPATALTTHDSTTTASSTTTNGSPPPVPSVAQEPTLHKKASLKWLSGGGSWRSKAPAIVKTAKESIGVSVSGGATSELPDQGARQTNQDSPTKFLSKRKSSKSEALPASMTRFNVTSDGSIDQTDDPAAPDPPAEPPQSAPAPPINEPPLPPEPPTTTPTTALSATFGWRSWWSRPDGYADGGKSKDNGASANTDDVQQIPLPGPTPSEEADAKSKELLAPITSATTQETETKDVPPADDPASNEAPPANEIAVRNSSSTSWFWLWSNTQNAQANLPSSRPPPGNGDAYQADAKVDLSPDAQQEAAPDLNHGVPVQKAAEPELTAKERRQPSAWAFWFQSKSTPNAEGKSKLDAPHKQVGEVAVFNTPSQSHPEAAQYNEQQEQATTSTQDATPANRPDPIPKLSLRSLRGRPKTKDISKELASDAAPSSKTVTPLQISPPQSASSQDTAPPGQSAGKEIQTTKQEPPNIILPEFRNTYRLVQKPTYWQQIRQYFLGGEPAAPHLHINPAPPRIKKAVAIGIHGYFPAPIFQKVLGQPTGTSIRFANAAKAAIEEWSSAHGYSPHIEQIALEGEGFIAERVNTLWKLLLNWIEHIKAADFILVACHSQGVPVAIMLVAKLIQFGCVNATRIGVCAMAGVNMGPFIEYKTKYFGPTAAELFEFGNPKSLVSQMYLAALDEVLRYGVRILYVGSIDDQLVPLESSTFSTLSHPYIYRAVFIDGRIHPPDFITHLVGFALKLRNLGLPDHGLIRELSPALAGSLYGGEGHSRVYEDTRVYKLAIEHALETTSLPVNPQQLRPATSTSLAGINIPVPGEKVNEKDVYALRVKDYERAGSANQNPYFLPWAMRGLLEEEFVKRELGQEVEELLAMFEDWRPTGKQLKDVKFRLEGVRSKL